MTRLPRFGFRGSAVCTLIVVAGALLTSLPLWSDPPEKPQLPAARLAATLAAHPDVVGCVAFSPDGKTLATGSYEVLKLWNLADNKEAAAWKTKGFVKSVAFSPDGKLIATGSYQSVSLWDVASGQPRLLPGHRAYVTCVAFSPDGKHVATASEDETAKVWNVADGKELLTLKGHAYPVNSIAFSPDGKLLATAAGDETRVTRPGEVKLWNAETADLVHTFPETGRMATAVAFSPDGKLLAGGSLDETVKLWNVETRKEVLDFDGHSRPVTSIAFAPGGKLVATGSGGRFVGGNEIKLWNPANGQELVAALEADAPVTSVAISRDGKQLAVGSRDKTATVWTLPGGETTVAAADAVAEEPATPPVDTAPPVEVAADDKAAEQPKELRAGIIGLDTSHAVAFTDILNAADATEDIAHCKIVAAYPKGSADIESSASRIPMYTEHVKGKGVEIADSLEALMEKVDVVFLETNDGRPHLEQALVCFKAGKPVFIDKPIAASLTDAVAIFMAADHYKVGCWSASSLRFSPGAQALRAGKPEVGEILGCDAYSPCSLESTHPDLFWYGIHGVETLFTVMGTGCEKVSRVSTPGIDLAAGEWKGGRIGTFRGIRNGASGYGGTAFGSKGIEPVGGYGGYRLLVVEIVKFFRTGMEPVSRAETLEIYAFMEAADESKRQGGKPVTLESVLEKANAEAKKRLADLGVEVK